MCLSAIPEENKKFVEKCKRKGRKWVWRYKIVIKYPLDTHYLGVTELGTAHFHPTHKFKLVGPIYSSYTYKPGINKSNSRAKLNKRRVGMYYIDRGIHVFNTWREADDHWLMCRTNNHIIKVRCLVKDFLGTDGYASVFKNIYISKREYNRCCNI